MARSVSDVGFEVCPHCNGIWVRGSDLKRFLESPHDPVSLPLEPVTPPPIGVAAHEPPRCLCVEGPEMSSCVHKNVVVDVCPSCGAVWLDGGEIAALMKRHPSGASRMDAADPPSEGVLIRVLDALSVVLDAVDLT